MTDIAFWVFLTAFLFFILALGVLIFVVLKPQSEPKVFKKKIPRRVLEQRQCPVCGTKLGPDDFLIGVIYGEGSVKKIIIRGCNHCYTPKPGDDSIPKKYLM